jgi:hypothetical protein
MIFYLSENNIFIINLKVCFTTFSKLQQNNIVKRIYLEDLNNLFLKKYNIYFIMRDPINRILSFYKDKIININKLQKQKSHNKQDCIKLLEKYYSGNISNMNISDIINAIKNGYDDPHIMLQTNEYDKLINILNKNNFEKKIILLKIEDVNFNNKLCNLLNISNIECENNTFDIKMDSCLLENDIIFLKKYYENDYFIYNTL